MAQLSLTRRLASAGPVTFSSYAVAAAFAAYFCMYAVRKPFAAATFDGEVWGWDLKIALVISQIVGYAISKFAGIRVVSQMPKERRTLALIGLVGAAELALVAFGSLPPGGKIVAIFFNGLPLGVIWGLVFSFLEGRRTSEILGAGLSTSYIVASGAVKTVGRWMLEAGISESWMPAATGACFFPLFLVAVWMLSSLPPPSVEDQATRTARVTMDAGARRRFFVAFAPGLVALTSLYGCLTAYRDFRDNFAVELLNELGVHDAAVFTQTELTVALAVLAGLAAIYLIRNNRSALLLIHLLMFVGSVLVGFATFAQSRGWIDGITWMTLVGVGLYLAYVPFGCVLFDRLIAAARITATAVFMIYVTDAFGYLGSILALLYRHFSPTQTSWMEFFRQFSYTTSIVCAICFACSFEYFRRRIPAS